MQAPPLLLLALDDPLVLLLDDVLVLDEAADDDVPLLDEDVVVLLLDDDVVLLLEDDVVLLLEDDVPPPDEALELEVEALLELAPPIPLELLVEDAELQAVAPRTTDHAQAAVMAMATRQTGKSTDFIMVGS